MGRSELLVAVQPLISLGAVVAREPNLTDPTTLPPRQVEAIVLPPLAATMDDCCRIGEMLPPPSGEAALTIAILCPPASNGAAARPGCSVRLCPLEQPKARPPLRSVEPKTDLVLSPRVAGLACPQLCRRWLTAATPLFVAEAEHLAVEHPNDQLICVTVRLDMDPGPNALPDHLRWSQERMRRPISSLVCSSSKAANQPKPTNLGINSS